MNSWIIAKQAAAKSVPIASACFKTYLPHSATMRIMISAVQPIICCTDWITPEGRRRLRVQWLPRVVARRV